MSASGGSGSYVWTKEGGGTNDSWLSINSSTGALTGTAPSATASVSTVISVADAEDSAHSSQALLTLSVKTLALSLEKLPAGFVGLAYAQALSAAGGTGAITYSIEPGGSNYSWLSISGTNLQAAGGPAAGNLGAVTVLIKATDGTNSDTRAFQFQVYNPVQIEYLFLPDVNAGSAYSIVIPRAGGTGSFSWTKETGGTNDSWLSVNAGTGRLSGTPTSSDLGSVMVIVKVTEKDYPSISSTQTLSFAVQGLTITTSALPDATLNTAYAVALGATGGSGYYAWSILTPPAWITIQADTGAVSGTPTTGGSVSLRVQVCDSLDTNLSATRTYSFWIVNTILKEDFGATVPTGWTNGGDWQVGARNTLYVGPQSAYSGSYCAATVMNGLYSASQTWAACNLTSPTFSLAGTTSPKLVFYQWYQTEAGHDGGNVKVSVNGQAGPFNVANPVFPLYTGTVSLQSAYTGFGVSPYGWQKVIVDLTPYAGQVSIAIQWSFCSDAGVRNPGWFVDLVHVFDTGGAAPDPKETENPVPLDRIVYAPPEPADFASGVTLAWNGALGANSLNGYLVYLGTDYNAVVNATPASPEYQGAAANPWFSAVSLSADDTYYWRVDSVGSAATTAGIVWRFHTANPVTMLVNEVQTYSNGAAYAPFVEIYNPSETVWQDVQGWDLTTTYAGGNIQATTITGRILLGPQAAVPFVGATFSQCLTTPYMAHIAVSLSYTLPWTSGTNEGEVWLRNPSFAGQDYVGFNVVTSNRPGDLNWSGTLASTVISYSDFRRKNNTDTDSASNWQADYCTTPTMGVKNPGQ